MMTYPTEEQIRDHAASFSEFCVSFYKANGYIRDMLCTVEIPDGAISGHGRPRSDKARAETLMVWDKQKKAIRSFRFDTVLSIGLPQTDADRAAETKAENESIELDRKQQHGEG